MTVGPPKSRAGVRTVALPAGVIPVLRARLAEYSEKSGSRRVFVGAHGATKRRSNFAPMWAMAIKRAGLAPGFRFHDLRHTATPGRRAAVQTCGN
jgi:integrase